MLWSNYNAPLILDTSERAPCFLHMSDMTNILTNFSTLQTTRH